MGVSTFSISNCLYNGTSGDPNPLCCVVGTVNGKNVYTRVFFRYLAAAEAAGQMQAALTAAMFNWYASVYGYQFQPWPAPIPFPTFSPSEAVAEHAQGPNPQPDVSYAPALIGSWSVQ